jgi:hypothetical protein
MFQIFRKNKPTVTEIIALQNIGIIGTIETRSWLAHEFKGFRNARREDVDGMIENYASAAIQEPDGKFNDFGFKNDEDYDD